MITTFLKQNKLTRKDLLKIVIRLFLLSIATVCVIIGLDNSKWIILPAFFSGILILWDGFFHTSFSRFCDHVIQYRWLLGFVVLLLLTICKVSGSSISWFNNLMPTRITPENATLFGVQRWIRADEYGVQTLKFFSQYYNNFSVTNNHIGISATNMIVDYFSPVLHISIIGKPLSWCYLLFGNEYGLSFYWNGLIILLLLTGFDMLMILTKKNRICAFAGALVVAFGPGTQWWVMPHMPIVLMYGMGLFDIGYYCLTCKQEWKRILFLLAAVSCATGFVISLFPSFQVPCGYLVAFLLLAVLYRDKDQIRWSKWAFLETGIAVLLILAILIITYLDCKDALAIVMNSAYPGERMITGPMSDFTGITFDFSSFITPFRDVTYGNNSEVASYAHFTILFLMTTPRLFILLKKENTRELPILAVFFCLSVFEIVFMCIGVPEILAKITLFKYCNRIRLIYEWTGVLFSSYGFSLLYRFHQKIKKPELFAYLGATIIITALAVSQNEWSYFAQGTKTFYGINLSGLIPLAGILAIATVLFLGLTGKIKEILFAAFLYIFICGITVNPVEIGTGAVYNHPLSATITEISENEGKEARFLATDQGAILSNYVLANGAYVVNATDFYYDEAKWEIIDPSGQYIFETNRYANQFADIVDGETQVELIGDDSIRIHFNPETLKKLSVHYVVGTSDYSAILEKYGIDVECILIQDFVLLFKLNY